ncbi:hypothetical protein [Dickeya oryzae]|uniref:hypothetical protein n=1 Tax=Dickeya oryzae TaxID=1240404 RepID=UPI001AEC820A|nr:hypothetical protein [Dickeya oryzae]MBP2851690.1 hypothetical protein [Dickeya oryzae]
MAMSQSVINYIFFGGDMGFEVSPDFLRSIKFNLLDPCKTMHFHGKCPHCAATIQYYEAHTSSTTLPGMSIIIPDIEEVGVMIGTCDSCAKKFKVNIINPDFSGFSSDWMKIDYYINSDNDESKQSIYKDLPVVTDFIDKNTILTERNAYYDFYNHPLYICDGCEKNLENISFKLLGDKWKIISERYWDYTNWSLSQSRGGTPKNIVIKFPFKCDCGKEHIANFVSRYQENNTFEDHAFSIINIFGSRDLSDVIFGVYTKTTIMTWLYKLIARWNFLYEKIYIISPFVGHQFLKSQGKVESWLKVLNRLDPEKTSILVRNGQSKGFKESFSKTNGINYEEMEKFNLGSELISELKNRQNFHAKIYCGISKNKCEIMNGSSNLVEGKSYEVINFDVIDTYTRTFEKFLKPLGIDDISNDLENLKSDEYSLLFDEENSFNAFIAYLYPKDYINFSIYNINPKA